MALFCPKEVINRLNHVQQSIPKATDVQSAVIVGSIDGRMKLSLNQAKCVSPERREPFPVV